MGQNKQEQELDRRLMEQRRKLFTTVGLPVLVVTVIVVSVSHYRSDVLYWAALGLTAFLHVFNPYFSFKNRQIKTPWGIVDSQSDGFDTFRWIVNLTADIFILIALTLSTAEFVCLWLILTFVAMTEVYQFRNRMMTFATALAGFVLLAWWHEPSPVTAFYLIACYVGLTAILVQLERWTVREMRAYQNEAMLREQVKAESESIIRDAVVGNQARMVMHEVNNMLFIIKSASVLEQMQRRRSDEEDHSAKRAGFDNLERIERSVNVLTKLSRLVLDDMSASRDDKREMSAVEFKEDMEMLLVRHFRAEQQYLFDVAIDPMPEGVVFNEYPGTTYLILHNIVKNSIEAVGKRHLKKGHGRVSLHAGISRGDLLITVDDNGPGMNSEKVRALLEVGKLATDKLTGHGLGLQFAFSQVQSNGYDLEVESEPDQGTTFSLRIPLVTVAAEQPERRSA